MLKSKNLKSKQFERITIGIFWLILFGAPLLFGNFENGLSTNKLLVLWRIHIPLFLAFLINRFLLLPRLFFMRLRGAYLVSVLVLVGVLTLLHQEYNEYFRPHRQSIVSAQNRGIDRPDRLRPPPPGHARRRPPGALPGSLVFSFMCLMVIGLDTGLKAGSKLVETEREKSDLERENIANQLAFLRNQISPHFFMNTLNNIHAQIDLAPEEAKGSIIKLSQLMRHLLYESESSLMPLDKEMAFIQSYVDLMRMRFSKRVDIRLDLPTIIPKKAIPPLLFTSIIENAFKHGISYENPSFVDIAVQCTEQHLHLSVLNSYHGASKSSDASGIGLQNTRRRLQLLYAEDFQLDAALENDTHSVQLTIPL